MNVLADIEFPDATEYVAIEKTEYNSKQYEAKIASGSEFSESLGGEISIYTLVLIDPYGEYRSKLVSSTNRYIANITVTLRDWDGSVVGTKKVESFGLPAGRVSLRLTDKIDLRSEIHELISTSTWSWLAVSGHNDDAIGEVVPQVYNTVARVKAYRVNAITSDYIWLISKTEISTVTRVEYHGNVINSSLYSLTSDGTYWYLKMTQVFTLTYEKYCWVDVTTPAYTPVEIVDDVLSGIVTVGANASFKTFLVAQGYTSSKVNFLLRRTMTAIEFLQVFKDSFSCDWRVDSGGEVIFTWVNRGTIATDATIKESDIINIVNTGFYEPIKIKNKIEYGYAKNNQTDKYNTTIYNGANQGDWGVYYDQVFYEFLRESVQAGVTTVERYNLNSEPENTWKLTVLEEKGESLYPGDKIKIETGWTSTPPTMKTRNPVYCQIFRKKNPITSGVIEFDVKDINQISPTWYILDEVGYIRDDAGYRIISE